MNLPVLMSTATTVTNLALITPQKSRGYEIQDNDGKLTGEAFLFNIEDENQSILESDITDHYVEDNTSIADQIALRPEIVTVRGFVGELSDVIEGEIGEIARVAKEKLVGISSYAPELTIQALDAYNTAFQAYQIAQSAMRTASFLNAKNFKKITMSEIGSKGIEREADKSIQSKQAVAYQQLYSYWRERKLFTLQTPWAIFKNMAIQSLKASQGGDTNVITDIEITFKMIRFSKTAIDSDILAPDFAEKINKVQGTSTINMGAKSLVSSSPVSILG